MGKSKSGETCEYCGSVIQESHVVKCLEELEQEIVRVDLELSKKEQELGEVEKQYSELQQKRSTFQQLAQVGKQKALSDRSVLSSLLERYLHRAGSLEVELKQLEFS